MDDTRCGVERGYAKTDQAIGELKVKKTCQIRGQ